jgi:putative aldouronate transport system substrate-binding protein
MRTDLLEEAGYTVEDNFVQDVESMDDLELVYEKVKAAHPDMVMLAVQQLYPSIPLGSF